ncbi:exodeoxyribonuclease VII small subunit [Sporosarcina sp. CAU 1771]
MENQPPRFEEAMQNLEKVVQQLETGDVPLEDAITLYKKGMELSAYCHGKLQDAEKQLISMIDKDGNKVPIDPTQGVDSDA